MLVLAAIIMVAQSTLALIPYADRLNGGPAKPVLGVIGLILQFFFCASAAIIAQYLVLWALGMYCLRRGARVRTFWLCSLATLPVTATIAGIGGMSYWSQLRHDYPIQSLAQRLDYERTAGARPAAMSMTEPNGGALLTSERSERSLETLYNSSPDFDPAEYRAKRLQRLHTAHVEQFINSPGFGVSRAIEMYTRPSGDDRPRDLIPQPEIPHADDATPESDPAPQQRIPAEELLAKLRPLHDSALVDFANQLGYGWVQDREHVVGFNSHAFRDGLGVLKRASHAPLTPQRVELVSLLKHDKPMVYDSANLPNMLELRNVPVRELDSFERRALPLLQNNHQDLVSEIHGNQIRLLGSICAAKQCLNCHSVSHGALLGAFSYRLQDGATSRPEPQETPPETF